MKTLMSLLVLVITLSLFPTSGSALNGSYVPQPPLPDLAQIYLQDYDIAYNDYIIFTGFPEAQEYYAGCANAYATMFYEALDFDDCYDDSIQFGTMAALDASLFPDYPLANAYFTGEALAFQLTANQALIYPDQ